MQETVTDVFDARAANNSFAQDVLGNQKETWVQVEEKAVAQLDGGYGAIANGGNRALAMEALTGNTAIPFSSLKQAGIIAIDVGRA